MSAEPATVQQRVETNWFDTLPAELVEVIRSYLSNSNKARLSGANYAQQDAFLNRKYAQYKNYLAIHPKKYWAALVHSYGQLKQDDLVSPVFLTMVKLGDVHDLEYLIALAKHNVHPVHIVHFLLRNHQDEAPVVARLICEHQEAFFCAFACMNAVAQTKIELCKVYLEDASISRFISVCEYHKHRYISRKVHHIERTNVPDVLCYNLQTAWSVEVTDFAPYISVYPKFQVGQRNNTVFVQSSTDNIFYQNATDNEVNWVKVWSNDVPEDLEAIKKETVKAVLTEDDDDNPIVLVQLLRSGNIKYVIHNHGLAEENGIMGLNTGPYVDIILAGESGDVVHYFSLSSTGKVYRVFLNTAVYTCNSVEIPLQDDVPVVHIVGIPNLSRTPFYLVTRDAQNKFCMYRFTDGTRKFSLQTTVFQTELVTQLPNIMLMPKTIGTGTGFDTDIVNAETIAFKKRIVAIRFRPDHPREPKFCLVIQQFNRNNPATAENYFKIEDSNVVDLEPRQEVPGFDIHSIVEMVQINADEVFCLMANGTVVLCLIDRDDNKYDVLVVAQSVPIDASESSPTQKTEPDHSAADASPYNQLDFRLRLRLRL